MAAVVCSSSSCRAEAAPVGPVQGETEYLEPVDLPVILLPPGATGKPFEQAIITVTLAVPKAKVRDVTALLPQLGEAFRKDLDAALGTKTKGNLMQGETLNATELRAHFMAVAEKIAGPGAVRDITLQITQGRI